MLKIVWSVRVVPGHVERRRSQCPSSLEVSTSKMIFRHKMESWSSLKMDFVINLSSQILHRCQDTGNNLYDGVTQIVHDLFVRWGHVSTFLVSIFIVCGGSTDQNGVYAPNATCDMFSLNTKKWESMEDMKEPRHQVRSQV